MKEKSVILLLGGNQGNVLRIVYSAVALIEKEAGRVYALSRMYSTKAWGPVAQPDFLNMVIALKTSIPPGLLMMKLLEIEKRFGRKREVKYGPRTLDIDILFYGSESINTKHLHIPHPELQNRRFALQPCMDIIPKFRHPVLKLSISDLFEICPDSLEVKVWKA